MGRFVLFVSMLGNMCFVQASQVARKLHSSSKAVRNVRFVQSVPKIKCSLNEQLLRAVGMIDEKPNVAEVKRLLALPNPPDVNARSQDLTDNDKISGQTPLTIAAYYGYDDVVDLLVGAGAGVNLQEYDGGCTALMHAAAANGHYAFEDKDLVIYEKYEKIIRALIRAGADITLRDENNKTVEDHANNDSVLLGIIREESSAYNKQISMDVK